MKTQSLTTTVRNGLMLAALTVLSAATAAHAAVTPLQGQLVLRPVTPGDVSVYALPAGTEVSGGLTSVGIGQPVYLEADINIAIPPADIVSVTWALTNRPVGSVAVLTNSPLGANVPVYDPSDRLISQVASRKLLRPDLAGQYTVLATITTATEGVTNVTATITAGTYLGVGIHSGIGCALCHSGGEIAQNKVVPWTTTAHSTIFSNGVDGNLGHYSQSCLQCHTDGYDTNTNAVNGGFDDIAAKDHWTFPTVLTNGNFNAMPADLQDRGNIQCENCHGPGSQHAYSLGDTNLISVTFSSGACNQCHDAPTHHIKGTEWYASGHAITTRIPAGNASCVGCHTGKGFVARMDGVTNNVDTSYNSIGCQTCHEPHGETLPTNSAPNAHLIRNLASVTFMDGTTVTNAGEGILCMQCHHARQNAAVYAATTPGSANFGPHHGPQGDMLEGVNGFTYGKVIPSSAHGNVVSNTCVACHMQTVNAGAPGFLLAGGHTFNMSCAASGTNGPVQLTAACQNCHSAAVNQFDFPLQDYANSGSIQGVQTEVQNLENELSVLLPPLGTVKTNLSINSSWTQPQLEAAYNWLFVNQDGSKGIHNTAYAVGLLKASIANLTGVSVPGGLPDAWVTQYFGSVSNPSGAPNANPSGDGMPNWMKYALGLNPLVAGTVITNGVVFSDVTAFGDTNKIHIYTAAEIAFDTQTGTNYQIQAIGSLSGGWINVGSPLAGTGKTISYLTPTRNNARQYYRVVHTP